ncbi:MAG: NAD-dependent epimerase/dehydratase family protein [Rhodopseudomonas sp.]|nr:NAD-dependent epimerase/dehydratase family protein [Rhodopseudomonas sp.]
MTLDRNLFCIGLGYSASTYATAYGHRFARINGTVRSMARQKALAIADAPVTGFVFGGQSTHELMAAMPVGADWLVSAPPAQTATIARAVLDTDTTRALSPRAVVYLSSLSVYGDYGGAWIDETAALRPTSERGQDRIAAENAWLDFGRAVECPVTILRLAGIYGPGRNALVSVVRGQARRIVKPNQVFNRIHVADIAAMIDAAFTLGAAGIFNGADDEPSPPQDVIAYAAQLLGLPAPPEEAFNDVAATMSPMARSFYDECKRASNRKIKSELRLTLQYPNYRAGLDALYAADDHERHTG